MGSAEIWFFLGENAQSKPNLCMQARVQVQNQFFLITLKILLNSSPNPPNPPKILPNSSQNRPKIAPEALLEPILGQCLKKAWFRTPKKRPRSGQERPEEAQDRPKTLPNGAQDPPKTDFCEIFGNFFSSSKFAAIFYRFFIVFLLFFKSSTLKIHAPTQCFVDFYTK